MAGTKPWENGGKPKKNIKKKSTKRGKSIADKKALRQVDKVESIKLLVAKFGMSNVDALLAYDKFHKKYESGEITKPDFLEENKVQYCKSCF